jgi:chorismate mutase
MNANERDKLSESPERNGDSEAPLQEKTGGVKGATGTKSLGQAHDIHRLRDRIDEIDQQLVRLLNERAGCALEIGRLKEERGQPIYQPAREAEVLANVRGGNMGPLDDGAMTRLFERIIDEARRLERLASVKRDQHGV